MSVRQGGAHFGGLLPEQEQVRSHLGGDCCHLLSVQGRCTKSLVDDTSSPYTPPVQSLLLRVNNTLTPSPAGCLTVALGGSVLATFVQPEPFVTGYHVAVLTPKNPKMTLAERLWWTRIIWENRWKYSYGRQANRTLATLAVPGDTPEWVTGTEITDAAHLTVPADPEPVTLPDITDWGTFTIESLFDVKRGGGETPGPSAVPYVTSSARNNGVTDYRELVATYPAGTLTVACDGSIGSSFWQSRPYAASSHVCVLTPRDKGITETSALFLCALIRQEAFRYSFGRAWQLSAMKRTALRLPVTEDGEPDWELMGRYIRSLPYSAVFAA